jgi:hypothetical protein
MITHTKLFFMVTEFTTKISGFDVSVFGLRRFLGIDSILDVEVDSADIIVRWYMEIDGREWGIKDLTVGIRSVMGDIRWYVSPDELTDTDKIQLSQAGATEMRNGNWEGEFQFIPDEAWTTVVNFGVADCYPSGVEIDFKNKSIEVS